MSPPSGLAWRTLANPDFRLYFVGNAFSNLGTWLQNTAQVLLAYRLTGSVTAVGLVAAAQFASMPLFGPLAGRLADRLDRRKLLLWIQLAAAAAALAMAVLKWCGALNEPLLIGGAGAIGLLYTFGVPPQTALVPALLQPGDDVRGAMALNGVATNVGRALAPLASVGIITFIGFAWAFALNSLSYLILATALVAIRSPVTSGARTPAGLVGGKSVPATRNRRLVILLLATIAVGTISTDPIMVLSPALARGPLHVPDTWAGYFIAALGVGTVAGSLVPSRGARLRHAILAAAVLSCSGIVFALAASPIVSLMAAAVAGGAWLLVSAVTQTLLLNISDSRRTGTVMAWWAIAYAGSRPVSSVTDGLLARPLGPQAAGVITVAVASGLLALIAFPEVRIQINRHNNIAYLHRPRPHHDSVAPAA